MVRFIALALCALGSVACGLTTEEEALSVPEGSGWEICPEPAPRLVPAHLPAGAVRLRARVGESYFVDECHRALRLEPVEVLEGTLHEPVLAIVPLSALPAIAPEGEDAPMVDLALEPDPEIPEAYRLVGG
jgi:hypothetical protein